MLRQNYLLTRWSFDSFFGKSGFDLSPAEFLAQAGITLSLDRLGILRGAADESLTLGMLHLWKRRRLLCGFGRSVPFWGDLKRDDFDRYLNSAPRVGWILYPAGGTWLFVAAMTPDDLKELQECRPLAAVQIEAAAEFPLSEDDDDFRLIQEGAAQWGVGFRNLASLFGDLRPESPSLVSDFPYTLLETNMTLGETHSLMNLLAPYLCEISDRKNETLSPHWIINGGQTEVQRRKRGKYALLEYEGRQYKIGCYQNQNEPEPVYWARLLGGVSNSPAYLYSCDKREYV